MESERGEEPLFKAVCSFRIFLFYGVDSVLRTASVPPLDRDKGTLPLTREKCVRIFPYFNV